MLTLTLSKSKNVVVWWISSPIFCWQFIIRVFIIFLCKDCIFTSYFWQSGSINAAPFPQCLLLWNSPVSLEKNRFSVCYSAVLQPWLVQGPGAKSIKGVTPPHPHATGWVRHSRWTYITMLVWLGKPCEEFSLQKEYWPPSKSLEQ